MTITIEDPDWEHAFAGLSPQSLAEILRELAAQVGIKPFQKTTQGDWKPQPPSTTGLRKKHDER